MGAAWLRYARMRRGLTQTDAYLNGSLGGIARVALACVAWAACSWSVGCASNGRIEGEECERNASAASDVSVTTKAADTRALVEALETLAAPWRDASGGLSLLREGHSAEPLRLVALTQELTQEPMFLQMLTARVGISVSHGSFRQLLLQVNATGACPTAL